MTSTPHAAHTPSRLPASRLLLCLLAAATLLPFSAPVRAQYPPTKPTSPLLQPKGKKEALPIEVRLSTGHQGLRAGMEFHLAVRFTIKPGWQMYWRNAGDLPTGATKVKLHAPIGFEVEEALWSGPVANLTPAGLVRYVYQQEATVIFPIKTPKDWESGDEAEFKALVEWTAESQATVRGKSTLELVLPIIGDDEPLEESDDLTELLNLLADMPADPEETDFDLSHSWSGTELLIAAPDAELLTFFPHRSKDWTLENAADCVETGDRRLLATIRDLRVGSKKPITGVIAVGKRVNYRVTWTYFVLKAERLAIGS